MTRGTQFFATAAWALAVISGQVVLYDANGHLLFSEGITGSCGHAGDNAGRNGVIALLCGDSADVTTAVYGCPLLARSPKLCGGETCRD